MRLPDVFAVTGFFNGSMNVFNTQLALKTNKGNVDVKGNNEWKIRVCCNGCRSKMLMPVI